MLESEHRHFYKGFTFFEHDHSHKFSGHTKKFVKLDNNHCHRILVVCEADNDHSHVIETTTGIGIYDEHGHYHRFIGDTSLNGRPVHKHRFEKVTSPPVGYYY